MIDFKVYIIYLAIMAVVTYLLRVIPFACIKGQVKNKFFLSFLAYIPYAVLGAMTFPAILYSTASLLSAIVGLVVAIFVAIKGGSLIKVAIWACVAVFLIEGLVTVLL